MFSFLFLFPYIFLVNNNFNILNEWWWWLVKLIRNMLVTFAVFIRFIHCIILEEWSLKKLASCGESAMSALVMDRLSSTRWCQIQGYCTMAMPLIGHQPSLKWFFVSSHVLLRFWKLPVSFSPCSSLAVSFGLHFACLPCVDCCEFFEGPWLCYNLPMSTLHCFLSFSWFRAIFKRTKQCRLFCSDHNDLPGFLCSAGSADAWHFQDPGSGWVAIFNHTEAASEVPGVC